MPYEGDHLLFPAVSTKLGLDYAPGSGKHRPAIQIQYPFEARVDVCDGRSSMDFSNHINTTTSTLDAVPASPGPVIHHLLTPAS